MQRVDLRVRNEHRELLFDAVDEVGRYEYSGDELTRQANRALNGTSGVERALQQAIALLIEIAAKAPPGKKTMQEHRVCAFLSRTCITKGVEITEWARQLQREEALRRNG